MTPEECAYIAGIIDGEGSIMLCKFHKNQHPSPCISIASTTLELLTWVHSTTKLGTIKSKKNYNTSKHKNSYTYVVKYNDCLKLLEKIFPYLVIESKRKRAHMIITQYKSLTPRNGRYSKELLALKENFYKEFIEA